MASNKPEYISTDPAIIVNEMIAFYEAATGKTLQPAQPERLLINAFAYRESLLRKAVNEAANQNLVAFSAFPIIDYLGELVGVKRLAASPATTTLQFTLVPGHGAVIVPQGTRVSSQDGKAVFATTQDLAFAIGTDLGEVTAECITTGAVGNSYAIGLVSVLLDPLAFVSLVENTDVTGGGADEETDDAFRERIKLAPESFSNAGSKGAYIYHAKSANATIIDVSVSSPTPGTVNIYPLVEGATVTPAPVLADVLSACNAEKVRPLTDTVAVYSPTVVNYSIQVDVTLYTGADATSVTDAIQTKLDDYTATKAQKLGLDVMRSHITSLAKVDGVYDVSVAAPVANLIIADNEFANCTGIVINIIGYNNG